MRHSVSKDRREQIRAAVADDAATWVQDQLGVTWWQTPQSFPLSEAADFFGGSADWLRGLIEHPVADALSAAGAAGPAVPVDAGITANFVTARVTAPLEGAARICEIVGIVIGVVTGMHALVMACANRLAHDEVHRELARGFEQIINSINADPEQSPRTISSSETPRPESSRPEHRIRASQSPDREPDIELTTPSQDEDEIYPENRRDRPPLPEAPVPRPPLPPSPGSGRGLMDHLDLSVDGTHVATATDAAFVRSIPGSDAIPAAAVTVCDESTA
jgi:hypothetical protein